MAMYPSKKKPTGNADLGTFTTNGQVTNQNVSGKATASFTINVPATVHTQTYTPATNKSNNDMGSTHTYRYVNTSGMITPSGTKSITANGTGIDVSSYATVNVNVPGSTLSGDAAVGNVLSGKTFYSTSTTKQTGTMTNNGAVSKTLAADDRTYTVPAGYHNGSGSVTVPAVTATKRVGNTSTSVDVASDDWTVSLNCGDRLYLSKGVIADGYSQGAVVAASLSSQTGVDSDKTAIDESHVLSGYQGWVNGSKVSGNYTEPTITDITPSDSSPVALATTGNYHPTSAGYAIKNSPTSITPASLNPVELTSGRVYLAAGGGYAIKRYNEVDASDSSPVFLGKSGTGEYGLYKVTTNGGGYLIKSNPTTLTPNDSDPPAIASGVIYKGGGAGFAVATKPSKTETTLWTNSSSTSSFAAKDVTGLSAGIDTFDYIRITYRASTSDSTSQSTTFAASELPSSSGRTTIGMMVGNSTRFRPIYKSSNTSIYFYASYTPSSTSSSNTYVIPTKIEGIKYSGI